MSALENTIVDILTPSEFFLSQNSPNPFREKTTIKFCVAYKTKVRLEVLNSKVKLIKVLIDEEKEAGTYEVEFDIDKIAYYSTLQSKEFYYRLTAGDYECEKKMVLLK